MLNCVVRTEALHHITINKVHEAFDRHVGGYYVTNVGHDNTLYQDPFQVSDLGPDEPVFSSQTTRWPTMHLRQKTAKASTPAGSVMSGGKHGWQQRFGRNMDCLPSTVY